MKYIYLFLLNISINTIVFADCDNDPNNLFQAANCSFNANLNGWDFSNGAPTHSNDDYLAQGASGSAEIHAEDQGKVFFSSISQCVNLNTNDNEKSYGVWVKSSTPLDTCTVRLDVFDMTNCTNNTIQDNGFVEDLNVSTNWKRISGTTGAINEDDDSLSALILIECANTIDFILNVDNAYLGPLGTLPVELQKFSID